MKRNIVSIDQSKCNGCGLCIDACHEGALELVDGTARLVSDVYCDGLGDCLPECPTGAITIIERDAEPFDEELVKERTATRSEPMPCGCPSAVAGRIQRHRPDPEPLAPGERSTPSELNTWPVQLSLVNPQAEYLQDAHLLIAADCAAYASSDFHRRFIRGRVALIGCPKLDDRERYRERLTEIFRHNRINSITVVRMEVPCCSGIVQLTRQAMLDAGLIVPYREVTIGIDGSIREI